MKKNTPRIQVRWTLRNRKTGEYLQRPLVVGGGGVYTRCIENAWIYNTRNDARFECDIMKERVVRIVIKKAYPC